MGLKTSLYLGKPSGKKSRIQDTKNISTDADSSTNIFVSAGVKKGAAAQGAFKPKKIKLKPKKNHPSPPMTFNFKAYYPPRLAEQREAGQDT